MSLADLVCAALESGSMSSAAIAARLYRAGHDVTDADVRYELARMFGRRVVRDGDAWRLLSTTPESRAANLARATEMVVAGLRRLAGERV